MQWLLVAMGGALGAVSRYGVNALLFPLFQERFPLATLAANVVGSLLMGFLYVVIIEKALLPPEWRNILMVGFLGAFTTFSAFSLETLALWQNGHLVTAVCYVIASVLLCLGATLGAIALARLI